jgi:hypothetical protein
MPGTATLAERRRALDSRRMNGRYGRVARDGGQALSMQIIELGLLFGIAALAGGCRTGETASHNLDVVLSSEDRLRYVGDIQSAMEALLADFVDPSMLEEGSWLAGGGEEAIKDPTDVAIENLLQLADTDDGPPRWREAEEVRHFARYAVACPAGLARERALIEIAPHGVRLGLTEPYEPPARPANAEELRVRISGLVDGARGLLVARSGAGDTALTDFEAACQVLAAAEIDLAGGRRALAAVSPFLRSGGLPERARDALVALSESLQRRLVGEALAHGLRDPLPYVRAAALRANTEVFGDSFLVEAALVVGARPAQELLPDGHGRAFQRFGLVSDEVDVGEARVEVFRLLIERGVPGPAAGTDAQSLALRFGLLVTLMQVATRFDLFESETRTHAMLALDAVSGARLGSIREEVWDTWWRETGPELQEAYRAEQRRATAPAEAAAEGAPPGDAVDLEKLR